MSEDRLRQQRPLDSLITTDDNSSQRSQEQHSTHPAQQYGERSVARTASNTHQAPLTHQTHGHGHGMSLELPPLPQASSATGGSFPSIQRSAGVSSILNPVSDNEQQARWLEGSQRSPPPAGGPSLPPLNSSYQTSQSIAGTPTVPTMSLVSSLSGSGERLPRRILTPRSPSLRRQASLSQSSQPSSATYSAQYAPFAVSPRSRSYAVEPGTAAAPPLPTPPAGLRNTSYGFPAPAQQFQTSRPSGGVGSARFRHASQSTSPRSSYSSFSQAASPATTGPSMPTLSSAYPTASESSAASGLSTSAPTSAGPDHQRAVGVPISSSGGQNVYQMMTLETTSGTVQLPVDVQAASRVADEKRRRNAGASARFRQRRKEKEKEASTTIGRLEQQVKELSEDLDFYKRERDYFAGVVLQVPGGDRHFPRPQSPRHRRGPSFGGSGSSGYMQSQMPERQSPGEGRNVRRRTSTASLPPPSQFSAYGQPHYGQAPTPQLPPPSHQLPQPPQPPQLMQAPPQTGPPVNPWQPYGDRQSSHQSRDNR